MAGRIKGITIEINGDTKGLDKALSSVNSNANKTQSELRDVNKLLKLDPGNTELIAQKQKLLAQAITQTGDKLKTLKDAQAQVDAQFAKGDIGEEQYRAFQREIASTEASLKGYKSQLSTAENSQQELSQSTQRLQNYFKATGTSVDDFKSVLGTRLVNAIKSGTASSEALDRALQMIAKESGIASSDMSKLTQTLDKVDDTNITNASKAIEDLGTKTEETSGKMDVFKGATMAEGLSQISDKAAEMGGAIVETAMDFGNAQSSMQNTMGLTATDAQKATDIVRDVFSNGMVDSVEEANEAVQDVINGFGTMTNSSDWGTLSNNLVAIAKHAGVDVKDAVNASSQAMKTLGLTSDQATDLISQGLQDGLNKNDDFLDTVNEYAPTFQDAGISAGGMLAVLNAGMDAGAFNTDKTADAIKEFQLRLTSGQLDEPMKQFSKSTQDAFAQFKDGKATSAEVMASVGQDLSKMPADKAKAAVQGIGTQFEDLGQQASSSLLMATTETEKTTGATKKMNEQTPGEKWTSALNTLKTAFSDVVIQMTPLLNNLADLVKWFNNLSPTVKNVIGIVGGIAAAFAVLAPVFAGISGAIGIIVPLIGGIISVVGAVVGAIGSVVAVLSGPVLLIIAAVAAAIAIIIVVFKNWGSIVSWIKDVWGDMVNNVKAIWNDLILSINIGIANFQIWWGNIWNAIKQKVSDIWNGIKDMFANVVNIIVTAVSNKFNEMKNGISNIFNAIKSTASNVWNGIKSAISSVVNGIKSTVTNIWNGIKSVTSSVFNAIKSTASSVWNGIKSTISSVVNGIKSTVSGVWNGIKSVTTSVWNGIKSAITGPIQSAKNVVSGIVDSIKRLFNFRLKFPSVDIPHIPLPHFSLSGSFNPLKGKIPHIGVNWYAKGGIFNKPTMFAAPGGFNGVGEAGPEAALPLNAKTLGGIGKGIAEATGGLGGDTINVTVQVMADTSAQTIKKLTDAVTDGITRAQNAKARAIGG
ncbi:phage tail tape measure protein [Leuconostoc suionicum]|uniref:phage tail tape measure protein n=1 Tax=Leuconostoc suionicum TaxID=1511761 RepID=UPI00233EC6D8|nr:phage tail tape measure protein [Leuconostoc suionicum]MDC2805550.1 phage tail tape measure protein [Leuconostoc suionicum]MDC2823062.1 phage tail tape measure protein [Leuconostoc suionicum]